MTGMVGGLALLQWLSGDLVNLLLGVSIIACAIVLLWPKKQRPTLSG